MARIIPDGWQEFCNSDASPIPAAALRHHETLLALSAGLSADYSVYHAVHWTTVERGFSVFGEVDFAIANRAGNVVLIAQKTGFFEEGGEGLVKRERGRIVNVAMQMARTVAALRDKLARRPGCERVQIDYLLYCPDYTVRRVEGAGLSGDRIVDARRRDELLAVIRSILPPGQAATPVGAQVDRFFRDVIELETDVSALVGQAQAMVTRISGGLAHWARQLDFSPFRLHVEGTAGSGKTQLALAEYTPGGLLVSVRNVTLAAAGQMLRCTLAPFANRPQRALMNFKSAGRSVRSAVFNLLVNRPGIEWVDNLSRSELWRRYGSFAFIVSPRGYGKDCHRTWEALALGCAVIVSADAHLGPLYDDLPVIVVVNWEDVHEANLRLWHAEIARKWHTYRFEKLRSDFWLSAMRRAVAQGSLDGISKWETNGYNFSRQTIVWPGAAGAA
jgi:hypothetical protein